MKIESVEVSDVSCLKTISKRALEESIVLDESERDLLIAHTAANVDKYCREIDCVFLKTIRGVTISGYILIKQYWNLSDLFVLPEFQGCGIGRMLLESAIRQVRLSEECEQIWVNSSLNAELFYRKLGFVDRTESKEKSDYSVPLKFIL
jgi:GNAT superfamily N-acetyltransferase